MTTRRTTPTPVYATGCRLPAALAGELAPKLARARGAAAPAAAALRAALADPRFAVNVSVMRADGRPLTAADLAALNGGMNPHPEVPVSRQPARFDENGRPLRAPATKRKSAPKRAAARTGRAR
jgi:hypothetical protein